MDLKTEEFIKNYVSSNFNTSKEKIEEHLNKWKNNKINIGVIGESGTDKNLETIMSNNIDSAAQIEFNFLKSINEKKLDCTNLPICSEKILSYLIECILLRDRFDKDNFEKEISEKLILLEKRLILEHLLTTSIQINNFNSLKNDIIKSAFSSAVENLKSILSSIRHFNIFEFLCFSKTNNEALEMVKNKNIYLLFGQTGVGKSTTLHFLAGSTMKEQKINGKLHVYPENVSNPDLKNVKTGLSAIKSETRSVIPVRIAHNEDEVLFCDLPGFGDRNGAEIDISNSIAINDCIQNCNGIKPIICLSYNNGDKLELFKSLTDILKGMFSNLEHNVEYFDYIFTKYPNEEKTLLKEQIKNIKTELENKVTKEDAFYIIIEDILNKSKNGLKLISPVEDNSKAVLETLITNSFITTPSRCINVSFSFESYSKLERQVKFEFNFITNVLGELNKKNTNEHELVLYKVKQLVELKNLVKHQNINELYDQCSKELVEKIFNDINFFIKNFNKKIQNEVLINENDKMTYLSILDKTEFCDDILKSLNVEKYVKHDEIKNNLYEQQGLMSNSLNELDLVTKTESMQINLNNILFVEKIINSFDQSEFQTNFCDKLKEKLKELAKNYSAIIHQSSDYVEISKFFSNLKKIEDLLGQYLDNSIDYYDNLKEQFIERLKNYVNISDRLLTKTVLEKKDLDELNSINEILKSAKKCVELYQHMDPTLIKSIYQEFFNQIFNFFNENKDLAVNYINESLPTISECSMNINCFNRKISNLFSQMSALRSNQDFKEITDKSFKEFEKVLIRLIERINTDINNFIYVHKTEHVKVDKIVYLAETMHKLNWTKDLNEFYYENEYKGANEAIFNYVELIKEQLLSSDNTFDDFIIFECACDKIKDLTRLKKISIYYKNIEPAIDEVKNWFLVQLNIKLDNIKEFFDKLSHLNMNYGFIEDSFLFLDKLKASKISFLPNDLKDVKIFIIKKLNEAFDQVKKEIGNDFESVKQNKPNFQIKKLRAYLNDQVRINQNFTNIKKFLNFNFQNYVDNINEALIDIHQDYVSRLNNLKKPKDLVKLNENIVCLTELTKLDQFMVDKSKCFSKLNKSYLLNFFDVINITKAESVRLINEHEFNKTLCDYFDIFSSLDKSAQINYETSIEIKKNNMSTDFNIFFNLEDEFNELKTLLNKNLQNIFVKCKIRLFQLFDIEEREIKTASIEFEKIKLAQENLQKYLDQNEMNKNEAEIKKLAKIFVDRCLGSIKKLMKQIEAHNKIEKYKNCKIYFDSFGIDLDEINDYVKKEEDYVSEALDQFNNYEIVDYVEFKVFPKDIYENLKKSNYYLGIIKFKRIIFEKYKIKLRELVRIKDYKKDEYKNGLKLYKKSLKAIPDDLNLNQVILADIEMDEENPILKNIFPLFFCIILVFIFIKLIYYMI